MQLAAGYAAHASRNKHINIDTHTGRQAHTQGQAHTQAVTHKHTHTGRHTQSQIRHANVNGEVGGQANSTEVCKAEKSREGERVKKTSMQRSRK